MLVLPLALPVDSLNGTAASIMKYWFRRALESFKAPKDDHVAETVGGDNGWSVGQRGEEVRELRRGEKGIDDIRVVVGGDCQIPRACDS